MNNREETSSGSGEEEEMSGEGKGRRKEEIYRIDSFAVAEKFMNTILAIF